MDSILKKGVLLVSLTGIMTAFPMAVYSAYHLCLQHAPPLEMLS